jgi:hypothetical protein
MLGSTIELAACTSLGAVRADDDHTAPVALRLITPGPWLRLDLDPRTRSGSLARLVGDRLGDPAGDDTETALARRELTATLRAFARDAAAGGAVHAAMLLDVVGGIPVTATVTASYATLPAGGSGDRVAAALDTDAGELERVALRLGPGYRLVAQGTSTVGPTLLVQYAVALPGQDVALLLSFGSPQVANADALLRLFDAIAKDARWIFPDRPA